MRSNLAFITSVYGALLIENENLLLHEVATMTQKIYKQKINTKHFLIKLRLKMFDACSKKMNYVDSSYL